MGLRLMSQLKKADQIWGRQQDLYYWVQNEWMETTYKKMHK